MKLSGKSGYYLATGFDTTSHAFPIPSMFFMSSVDVQQKKLYAYGNGVLPVLQRRRARGQHLSLQWVGHQTGHRFH